MRSTSRWWYRAVRLWDGLCAFCDSGVVSGLRLMGRTFHSGRHEGQRKFNAVVAVEALEPRFLPSGNPPVAYLDSWSFPNNQGISGSVLANDTDPENDSLTAVQVAGVAHGTLTFSSSG